MDLASDGGPGGALHHESRQRSTLKVVGAADEARLRSSADGAVAPAVQELLPSVTNNTSSLLLEAAKTVRRQQVSSSSNASRQRPGTQQVHGGPADAEQVEHTSNLRKQPMRSLGEAAGTVEATVAISRRLSPAVAVVRTADQLIVPAVAAETAVADSQLASELETVAPNQPELSTVSSAEVVMMASASRSAVIQSKRRSRAGTAISRVLSSSSIAEGRPQTPKRRREP